MMDGFVEFKAKVVGYGKGSLAVTLPKKRFCGEIAKGDRVVVMVKKVARLEEPVVVSA